MIASLHASSGRAASTPNHQAISLAPFHLFPIAEATEVRMVGYFPVSDTTLSSFDEVECLSWWPQALVYRKSSIKLVTWH